MLQLKNVSKFYYNKGVVTSGFSKVSLRLDVGEFVAITGESGSGKSTLLNVLSGLDSYEEGEMYVDGEDTSAYSETEWEKYRRKYISNIFQNFNLVNSYTVYQNVELALLLSGSREKDHKERILEVLRKVDLYEYRNQRASRLSGGQKQRVAIARALVRNTPIIVADEPTGNLDSQSAANVIEMLSRVASDKLVLVVTHNYEQVENYVTRRITMHDGRIIEDVRLRDVLPAPENVAENADDVPRGVYEDQIRRISPLQRLRLGVRNAFNILPKFLLLLLVFLFASVATAGYYASDLVADSNRMDYSYNYYFNNTSRQRIIIKKTDGSPITASDFEKLRAMDNVETVYEDDLLLDNIVSFSGDYELQGRAYSLENYIGTPEYGTMPTNDREFILALCRDDYLADEDTIYELMEGGLTLYDWSSDSVIADGLRVSGVAICDEQDYQQKFYCPDAILNLIRSRTSLTYSTAQITINDQVMTVDPYLYEYRLTPSDKVEPGEATVSEEVAYLFESGRCIGKPLSVHISNPYYEADVDYTITDTYNEKSWSRKTDQPAENYDWQRGMILIHSDDYAKLFSSDIYQSSVFVADTELLHDTAAKLEDAGYTTMCMADTLVDDTSGYQTVQNVLSAARSVILFLATFFVTYFVIRLIMKSRNTYFSTIRILGATRGDCRQLLFIDLTTVLCVAFLLFTGSTVLIRKGVIQADFLLEFLDYLEPMHYVILFGILLLTCLLISLRYSRKLFQASAMKTYKEVG